MSGDLVTRRVADLLRAPHEHEGQRVVTLAEVDRLHGRPKGTAKAAFRRNKHRLTEGVHFVRGMGAPNVPPTGGSRKRRGGHRGVQDQVRIPGVDFRAVVSDLSDGARLPAQTADVDLVGVLGQLVEQAVNRALAGRTA